MKVRDLVPRIKGEDRLERRWPERGLTSLQRDMNRLFDNFFTGFDMMPSLGEAGFEHLPSFSPRVNVAETEKEVEVTAELPGMDEKDVTVELDEDTLTIRGEKKEEREEKGKNWSRVETSYGSFHRMIPLPARVQTDKAGAKFKKGMLTVTLPKHKEALKARKSIAITAE